MKRHVHSSLQEQSYTYFDSSWVSTLHMYICISQFLPQHCSDVAHCLHSRFFSCS